MRRRLPASPSTSTATEEDDVVVEGERRSEEPLTMTLADQDAPRRVPPLPEEYEEEEEEERRESPSARRPSSSPARFSLPSLRRFSLLVLPLLLQLLQPAAACQEGCECSEDLSRVVCASLTSFPFLLPPTATHVDLSGSKLVEFPGDDVIRTLLPDVHTLIMRNCSLQFLPAEFLNGLSALRRLDLAENDIKEVHVAAFSGVDGLEHLDLSSNRRLLLPMRSLDLQSLRTLDLSDCGLTELDKGIFDGLGHLEKLRLEKNSLSHLPRGLFSKQHKLEELDLAGNKLTSTDVLTPPDSHLHSHLRRLNLSGNMIKYMNRLDELMKLERLDASANRLASLPPFPSSLHWLDLSHNELRTLQTAAFDSLTDLRHLDLSNNRDLDEAKINVFVSLSSLEYLSLAHCSDLATFGPAQFQPLPATLRSLHLEGVASLSCDDCKMRSFPSTVQLHGYCTDKKNERVRISSLGSCDGILNQATILIGMGAVVIVLVLILVLLIVCCSNGRSESRPVTPITAKHASYGYGGHRKLKGKHSSLSPPLLASSSSSSTSPSGRDVGVYEARLGAGPLGGGIIYGAGGYLDWEGPITMEGYGRSGGESSSGNSSGRSDYSEIPAYTQNRYCVPKSTVARAFSGAPLGAPGTPRLPQTPPPSTYPQGMFPHTSGTLYPPPKYSPPPPPAGYVQHEQPQQLLLQTPLALQQQLQQQHAAAIQPPCAYSPLTRL